MRSAVSMEYRPLRTVWQKKWPDLPDHTDGLTAAGACSNWRQKVRNYIKEFSEALAGQWFSCLCTGLQGLKDAERARGIPEGFCSGWGSHIKREFRTALRLELPDIVGRFKHLGVDDVGWPFPPQHRKCVLSCHDGHLSAGLLCGTSNMGH